MSRSYTFITAAVVIMTMTSVGIVDGDSDSSSQYSISRQTYTKNGKCVSNLQIEGNGVIDSFEVVCFEDGYFFQDDDEMVYCIPPVGSFCLYSNQASMLVVDVDGECTKKTYVLTDSTVDTSSYSMSDDDCAEVMQRIEAILNKHNVISSSDSQSEENTEDNLSENSMLDLSSMLKASAKQSSTHIEVNTKTVSENGDCKRVIEVNGKGITDVFSVDCSDISDKILQVDGKVVVGKPQDSVLFFSDSASTLVVISEGRCTKKTYSDNTSDPESSSLSEDECAAVQEEIAVLYSGSLGASSSSDWL